MLALSGSLRAASLNKAMLDMAADCAPAGVRVIVHAGLGDLPLFDPDLELQGPRPVARFRDAIAAADDVLIASPEYAHGISGVMRNALDRMVGSGVFVAKPVVLWNASPRASHALAALREALTVMSARLMDRASLELLIRLPDARSSPLNPDPHAMRRSLLLLRDILREERLVVTAAEKAVPRAAS